MTLVNHYMAADPPKPDYDGPSRVDMLNLDSETPSTGATESTTGTTSVPSAPAPSVEGNPGGTSAGFAIFLVIMTVLVYYFFKGFQSKKASEESYLIARMEGSSHPLIPEPVSFITEGWHGIAGTTKLRYYDGKAWTEQYKEREVLPPRSETAAEERLSPEEVESILTEIAASEDSGEEQNSADSSITMEATPASPEAGSEDTPT